MGANKENVKVLGSGLMFEAKVYSLLNRLVHRQQYACLANPGLADGTTDGEIKTANAVSYRIAGQLYSKAATDDLWDIKGETNTVAGKYRAYALWLNAAGTASFEAHGATDADSEAEALAALAEVVDAEDSKCLIGVYVAGPSTDFDGAAGLDSFGTFYNGMPAAQEVAELFSL